MNTKNNTPTASMNIYERDLYEMVEDAVKQRGASANHKQWLEAYTFYQETCKNLSLAQINAVIVKAVRNS